MTSASQSSENCIFIAFGNNLCGNLDPTCSSIIRVPTDVTVKLTCNKIRWCSWASTIGDNPLCIWGNDSLVKDSVTILHPEYEVKRVIGVDQLCGFLLHDGTVKCIQGDRASDTWDDVASTGMGTTYACKDGSLYRYESFENFMQDLDRFGPIVGFPPLDGSKDSSSSLQIFATESRAFALVTGPAQYLYELIDTRTLPPKLQATANPVQLEYIDELEALGKLSVVAGSRNRLGVVTEVGSGYIIPAKGEIEELTFDDEDVRLMGVGSNFEVVVTDKNVYVRGSSKCLFVEPS